MGIGEIKSSLNSQRQVKDTNNRYVAKSHETSLFYAKDITQNQSPASKYDNFVYCALVGLSSVIELSDTYGYNNTSSSLKRIKKMASKTYTEIIMNELKRASKISFDKYSSEYNNNFESLNSQIKKVENYIKEYQSCENKINSLRKDISAMKQRASLQGTAVSTGHLENQKESYKRKQKIIISNAKTLLIAIGNLNKKNTKLLADGLRQA